MENIVIDGTPFSVLLDRAVKIKSSHAAAARKKYDALPSFLQSSLISSDEVAFARNLEFDNRIETAMTWKEDGNAAYREGRFDDALEIYKTSLHVFRYLLQTNPDDNDIKNFGIKDEYLREVTFHPKSEKQQQQLDHFFVNIYNNIAITCLKKNDFSLAIQACDCAVQLDKENDKSFYLRSQARLAIKSASANDEKLAMADLRTAVTLNPKNKKARQQLQALSLRIKTQRAKDKNTFTGLFNRGEIYYPHELEEEKKTRKTEIDAIKAKAKGQEVVLARQLAQIYDERALVDQRTKNNETLRSLQEERKAEDGTDSFTISSNYPSIRDQNIARGTTKLCVILFFFICLLNTFLQHLCSCAETG